MLWLILSFLVLWFGSGLIIQSVDIFSRRIGASSFFVSFFLLGLLTSLPELALGLTAVAENTPAVYVGNLIGGILLLFFGVIPLYAVLSNGVLLGKRFSFSSLFVALLVILLPSLFMVNGQATLLEATLSLAAYLGLFVFLKLREKPSAAREKLTKKAVQSRYYSFLDLLKVLVGVALVFVSSRLIVEQTLRLAANWHIPLFSLSVFILALGTNLPEISLAFRAVLTGKKEIALGDYLGSAAANTLLFGFFTWLHGEKVTLSDSFAATFLLLAAGLALFFFFTRSKYKLSRSEGVILWLFYFFFILVQEFSLLSGFFGP